MREGPGEWEGPACGKAGAGKDPQVGRIRMREGPARERAGMRKTARMCRERSQLRRFFSRPGRTATAPCGQLSWQQ